MGVGTGDQHPLLGDAGGFADTLPHNGAVVSGGNCQVNAHQQNGRTFCICYSHAGGADILGIKIPEPFVPKVGARIMSLTNPTAKMSKSENEDTGRVLVMDTPETIMRQFKRAITDSDTENCVRYDKENKPGVSNLMTIYAACTGKTYEQIEAEFAGCGYGKFKPAVGEAVVETLRPIREESTRLMKDKAYLESVYRAGAEKASYVAEKTLRKVYKKVGFVAR